jgi:DNA polymerase elongation subunit (family B)
MFKNVYYETYKNLIHLWYETEDGKQCYRKETWVPYVFKEDEEGTTKTIYGKKAKKIKFKSYSQYSEYQKNNKEGLHENHCKSEIQYLVDKYHKVEDDDIIPPKLKVYSLDIEVHTENKPGVFPSPQKAEEPITAITVYDFLNDHYYTFGLHPYDNKRKDVTYFECVKEEILLQRFLEWAHTNPPDVYTGWNISYNAKMNISGFDFPYIINRAKNILEKDAFHLLSPIKKVRIWEKEGNFSIAIAGVSLLDYQALYKWYSFKNPERYTLDYISELELDEKKLEYEGTLSELYENDWQRYIDYNIKDTYLIKQLDDKLGYIALSQSLSLLTRAPMENFTAMTQLLEGKLLVYYRRNNLCAPFFAGGTQIGFPAAYVKEPQSGLHSWICSVDIASSYPTAIVTLNMSIETYLGRIMLSEDEILNYIRKREFPEFSLRKNYKNIEIKDKSLISFNNMIKKQYISVSPCGTIFDTRKTGVIAHMEKHMFLRRKEIKKKMKSLYGIEGKEDEVKRKHTFQWALKILLNSMYGIMAVPYSRYFKVDIAEAITSCGRHSIKSGEQYVNEILNNPNEELKKLMIELQ